MTLLWLVASSLPSTNNLGIRYWVLVAKEGVGFEIRHICTAIFWENSILYANSFRFRWLCLSNTVKSSLWWAHLRAAASTNCHSHCTFSSTLQTHFPVWPSIFRLFHLLCTTPSTRHIVLLLGKVRWIVRLCGGVWNTILNNLLPCKWQPGTNDRFDATFKWMRSQWGSSTYSLLCYTDGLVSASQPPHRIEQVEIQIWLNACS